MNSKELTWEDIGLGKNCLTCSKNKQVNHPHSEIVYCTMTGKAIDIEGTIPHLNNGCLYYLEDK